VETWDYIVVGAGSAGAIVAARLTESGRHRVLLLEAGPDAGGFWLAMPMGYGKSFYDPAVNWMYMSEPNAGLGGRKVYVPRGKVLGGSSTINAMVYSRGQASDFADWTAAGNPGWDWPSVLATYRRMENHDLGESQWHGSFGPVHVTDTSALIHPMTQVFLTAGVEAGLPLSHDLNGATIEGVGPYQITTVGGQRVSTAQAYLHPARRRRNLRIETEALTTKILFEGKRASGVRYQKHGKTMDVQAGKEVIVAGGTINSAQLLQLSGVGSGDLLQRHGISMVHALAGVGQNVQDHICYDHTFRANVPTLNEDLRPIHKRVLAGLDYILRRRGPLTLSLNQGGGYFHSRPGLAAPNVQLYFCPLSYEKGEPGVRKLLAPDPFPGFYLSISPCRPTSRGSVTIRSADPHEPPAIHLNLLSTDEDAATAVEGARFLRKLAAAPAFGKVIAQEMKPGPKCASDAELLADIRAHAYSVFHPVGSCRMGPDPAHDVVDARLRVHGLKSLRVIDASVFPFVTSGNTNAPAMMIGERGAQFLLEDAVA
jgi:choline dehydrogenase